jgi:hypothetical protein
MYVLYIYVALKFIIDHPTSFVYGFRLARFLSSSVFYVTPLIYSYTCSWRQHAPKPIDADWNAISPEGFIFPISETVTPPKNKNDLTKHKNEIKISKS